MGWCLVRWEDGMGYSASAAGVESGEKEEFLEFYTRDVRRQWDGIVGGKKHVGESQPYFTTS